MPRVSTAAGAGGAPAPSPPAPLEGDRSPLRRVDRALVVITVLAAALRFWGLGTQSLWYDEWLTTEAVSGGPGHLLDHVTYREGMPPPFFVLSWAWVRIFGEGELALRALPALFGVATVPVVYAIGRQLGRGPGVARLAALLVAVNPMLVWYSQEARPYSLLALVGAVTVLLYLRADRTRRTGDLAWWGVACAGALAVHYFAVFVVVPEAVGLVALRAFRRRDLLLAGLPGVVVLAILAPIAVRQHDQAPNHEWISAFALSGRIEEAVRSAFVGPSPPDDWMWLVGAATAVLAAGALVVGRRRGPDRGVVVRLAAIGAAGVVLPLAAVVLGTDVFLSRYLVAAAAPLIVLWSAGLASVPLAWLRTAAVVAVVTVSVVVVAAVEREPELQRADWATVADRVESGGGDGVLLVNFGAGQSNPLRHYVAGLDTLDGGDRVAVDRIDVLVGRSSTAPCNFFVGRACAFVFLGAPLPPALAPSFALEARHEAGQFVVERYRAAAPVSVSRADLLGPSAGDGAVVWVR
jgi:mannosyltransferase